MPVAVCWFSTGAPPLSFLNQIEMRNPSPERKLVVHFPTPEVGDVLFYEIRDRTLPKNDEFAYGDPHPDSIRYPNHELVYVGPDDQTGWTQWWYAKTRDNQDDYNFEFSTADMGGQKFDIVERTYVIKRADFDPDTPIAGAAIPNDPDGMFTSSGMVLMKREQIRIGQQELDSLYVVEKRTYVAKVSIWEMDFDEFTGKHNQKISTFYYRGEIATGATTIEQMFLNKNNAWWGLQADGTMRTGQQVSADWFLVTQTSVIGGNIVGGILTIHDYLTTEDYYWPAVLSGIKIFTYTLRMGGTESYGEEVFSKEAYRGPCRARIQTTWSVSPFALTGPQVMLPLPITINTPLFSISIGPTLHTGLFMNAVIANHPKYALNIGTFTWPATSPTDWPSSIVAVDQQRPFRGGFLRTVVTVYPPEF